MRMFDEDLMGTRSHDLENRLKLGKGDPDSNLSENSIRRISVPSFAIVV